ncbi:MULTISPECIES: LysR substrate-binding domain-containing protein [unclassified Leisingera]|uniref:LysR substrate-binding domain-containing protein n=1 Tax=unclassified Leisingera TaxID=2614906 RepID=UPI001012019E|nr:MULTISPECIES: LysR substrate-binding domain-containing protein [unclassified Leisingera]MCF6432960.1 LysR substrate-binding domain-containing protein [Leisingera sp. MMG026]QAX28141.1 LysR family transcriptional regulator [Leisingera sp. NJS204]
MQLNSRLLECFHATMSVGTVTGAAEILNTSQPAVSRSLRQLEDAVKMTLFNRSGNRVVPTQEALLLYEEVDTSFRSIRRISRAAEEIRNLQQGRIHIACAPAYSQGFLVSAVKAFNSSRPDVQTVVTTRQTPTISELVASRQCDIGLAAYAIEPEGTVHQPFTDAPEICMLPEDHPLCRKAEISPQDLDQQRFVALGQNDAYTQRLNGVLEALGVVPATTIEVHNSIMAAEAVAQGVGVAIINPFSALSFKHRPVVFRRFTTTLPFKSTLLRSKFQPASALVEAFEASLFATRDNYLREIKQLVKTG